MLVSDANEPPQLIPAQVLTLPLPQTDPLTYSDPVACWDPDQNDVLRYSITENEAGLQIDPVTGQLLLPAGSTPSAATELEVEVSVSDARGLTDSQVVTVHIPAAPVQVTTLPEEAVSIEAPIQSATDETTLATDPLEDTAQTTSSVSNDPQPLLPSDEVSDTTPINTTSDTADAEPFVPLLAPELTAETMPLIETETNPAPEATGEPVAIVAPPEPKAPSDPPTASEVSTPVAPAATRPQPSAAVSGLSSSAWFVIALGLVTLVVLVQVFMPENVPVSLPGETLETPAADDASLVAAAVFEEDSLTDVSTAGERERATDADHLAASDDLFELEDRTEDDTDEFPVEEDLVAVEAAREDAAIASASAALKAEPSSHSERAVQLTDVMSEVLATFSESEQSDLPERVAASSDVHRLDFSVPEVHEGVKEVESVDDWLQRVLKKGAASSASQTKTLDKPALTVAAPLTTHTRSQNKVDSTPLPTVADVTQSASDVLTASTSSRATTAQQDVLRERERLARLRQVANESARGHIALARQERTRGLWMAAAGFIPVCFVSGLTLLATQAMGPRSEGIGIGLVGIGVGLFGLYTSRTRTPHTRSASALPSVEKRGT